MAVSKSTSLVDINLVEVNSQLEKEDRICDFINKVKNPYHFRVGNVEVITSFIEGTETLQEKIERYVETAVI